MPVYKFLLIAWMDLDMSCMIAEIVHQSPLSEGFVSAFLLILLSELGDKTFFIAVLLALKHSKSVVFAGSFGALAVMTVISVRRPSSSCINMAVEKTSLHITLL